MSNELHLAKEWDVLGPFPIHAREQHYLSPAFPLDLSKPVDFDKKWPSSYADNGLVGWSKTTMDVDKELRVSFPDVRWKYLRSFEGWAALQHHAVLRTTFQLPSDLVEKTDSLNLRVHLHQGSYFTVVPKEPPGSFTPKWYAGNIYDLPRSSPQTVELPFSSSGEYQLFVSGDYEIRLFGDPTVQENSDVPVQRIKIDVSLERIEEGVTHACIEPSLNTICDFVNGYAFGIAVGIGLRNAASAAQWIIVDSARLVGPLSAASGLEVTLLKPYKIAPTQTRVIPLVLSQTAPLDIDVEEIEISLLVSTEGGKVVEEVVTLPVHHRSHWSLNPASRVALKATFFFASSHPSIFAVLPPLLLGEGKKHPPILALHGAGVDPEGDHLSFWSAAMPKNEFSWIIMPTGRTAWGLDWHGPSAQEAWDTVSALSDILHGNECWKPQAYPRDSKVFLIGHSNGGQGVWHMSTHFPDRVIAAIPAAGYVKSQSYVPLSQSRSAHYIDPILRSILESSLTPDDNDLHLSNIAHLPLLGVHGGADENVPSWHSRELVSVLRTLNPEGDFSFKEDAGQGHWYDTILNNPVVQEFVDKHVELSSRKEVQSQRKSDQFTLTVSNPTESGSLQGWRITSLKVPGRLGVLRVRRVTGEDKDVLTVSPTNVQSFTIDQASCLSGIAKLNVASTFFVTSDLGPYPLTFKCKPDGSWAQTQSLVHDTLELPPTRLQNILTTLGPIGIIYTEGDAPAFSLAKRIAHDLLLYHRLDARLIPTPSNDDADTHKDGEEGNEVVIGTIDSALIQSLLRKNETSFNIRSGVLHIEDQRVPISHGESYIFSHPSSNHNTHRLVIIYTDEASLERAGRLFPIRTGVSAPNWLYLSPAMDSLGAAGLKGAGVWGPNWKVLKESSWMETDLI